MLEYITNFTKPELVFKIALQSVFVILTLLTFFGKIPQKAFIIGALILLSLILIKNIILLFMKMIGY